MTGSFRVRSHAIWAVALCGVILGTGRVSAAEFKCLSETGALVSRSAFGQPWKIVEKDAVIPFGNLIIPLPDSSISDGEVKITSRADFDNLSPLPIIETAYTLNKPATGFDLDITLDRGRIELLNLKKEGLAKVKFRFLEEEWNVELSQPGSRVTLEMYGRWPQGTVFRPREPKSPTVNVIVLVTDLTAKLETDRNVYPMSEPPGYALFSWDSTNEDGPPPVRLGKLPEWADPETPLSEQAKITKAALEEFRKLRVATSPDEAIDTFFKSKVPLKERISLISMAAQDDMMRLGLAVSGTHDEEIWNTGIIVLRHWLGRGPGYDVKLFEFLTTKRPYKPIQARIIMQLLFGFGEEEHKTPEFYELLIEYLNNDAPAIRNLAAWHLYRLMPSMRKKVPYVPNATKEEFTKLYEAWKMAIPAGKLPPVEVVVPKEREPKPTPKSGSR